MSYYLMHRGWMERKIFEREPFDRRSAWVWLIEHAMFAETNRLGRGQVRASYRDLAEAWGWELTKVFRYLKALRTCEMITTQDATGDSIISICNYDRYQIDPEVPQRYPQRDRNATRNGYNNEERRKEEDSDSSLRSESESSPNGERQSARQIAVRMIEVWKEELTGLLRVPTKLPEARVRSAAARYRQECGGDIEEWRRLLIKIRGSPFLLGDGGRGWRADFDFAIHPKNFMKISEGKYDPPGRNAEPTSVPKPSAPSHPLSEDERDQLLGIARG